MIKFIASVFKYTFLSTLVGALLLVIAAFLVFVDQKLGAIAVLLVLFALAGAFFGAMCWLYEK